MQGQHNTQIGATLRRSRIWGGKTVAMARLGVAAITLAGVVASASVAAAGLVDINTASMAELEALPGIGAAKAAAIIEERQVRPFGDVEDLERVRGIGPALLAQLREHVTVSPPKKPQ